MSKTVWFRTPAQEAVALLMRELRASVRSAASLAREAGVAERTAARWVKHPEQLKQVEEVIELLYAAEVPAKRIAKIYGREFE